jgi:hypothetical protein
MGAFADDPQASHCSAVAARDFDLAAGHRRIAISLLAGTLTPPLLSPSQPALPEPRLRLARRLCWQSCRRSSWSAAAFPACSSPSSSIDRSCGVQSRARLPDRERPGNFNTAGVCAGLIVLSVVLELANAQDRSTHSSLKPSVTSAQHEQEAHRLPRRRSSPAARLACIVRYGGECGAGDQGLVRSRAGRSCGGDEAGRRPAPARRIRGPLRPEHVPVIEGRVGCHSSPRQCVVRPDCVRAQPAADPAAWGAVRKHRPCRRRSRWRGGLVPAAPDIGLHGRARAAVDAVARQGPVSGG